MDKFVIASSDIRGREDIEVNLEETQIQEDIQIVLAMCLYLKNYEKYVQRFWGNLNKDSEESPRESIDEFIKTGDIGKMIPVAMFNDRLGYLMGETRTTLSTMFLRHGGFEEFRTKVYKYLDDQYTSVDDNESLLHLDLDSRMMKYVKHSKMNSLAGIAGASIESGENLDEEDKELVQEIVKALQAIMENRAEENQKKFTQLGENFDDAVRLVAFWETHKDCYRKCNRYYAMLKPVNTLYKAWTARRDAILLADNKAIIESIPDMSNADLRNAAIFAMKDMDDYKVMQVDKELVELDDEACLNAGGDFAEIVEEIRYEVNYEKDDDAIG